MFNMRWLVLFIVLALLSGFTTGRQDQGMMPDLGKQKPGAGIPEVETGPGSQPADLPEVPGERALISGVPHYYQATMEGEMCPNLLPLLLGSPVPAGYKDYKTGCGPVAAVAVMGWWERRGVDGLLLHTVEGDGLPQDTIIEIGQYEYLRRLPDCDSGQAAVTPSRFETGFQNYLDDHGSVEFTVTKYKITKDSDFDQIWDMVKEEIDNGRPLVYLLRHDGLRQDAANDQDNHKLADHYIVIVGYDTVDNQRVLVGQYNFGYVGYYDHYFTHWLPLEVGDYTTAYPKYHLFAIRPVSEPDYMGECSGWLLNTTRFHEADPYDGVQSEYFRPYQAEFTNGSTWKKTNVLEKQDGICFVARWIDSDEDGIYDGEDNCPDIYNPGQENGDGDDYGDICDYPDIVLEYGYRDYSEVELGDGRARISFTIDTNLTNQGTDPIVAGTSLVVKWVQEAVTTGGEKVTADEDGEIVPLKITQAKGSKKLMIMENIPDEDEGGSGPELILNVDGMLDMPLERSQQVTLSAGLLEGGSYSLDSQTFSLILDEGECATVTHTIYTIDSVDEMDGHEDNEVVEVPYNKLSDCFGVAGIDPDDVIDSILGPQASVDGADTPELDKDIAEAGIDQIIGILQTIGPEGGTNLYHDHLTVDFPAGAVDRQLPLKVKIFRGSMAGFDPVGEVYDIQFPPGQRLNKPVTLSIGYGGEDLAGVEEGSLAVHTFSQGRWTALPSEVDTAYDVVSTQLNHFTLYALAPLGQGSKTPPKPFNKSTAKPFDKPDLGKPNRSEMRGFKGPEGKTGGEKALLFKHMKSGEQLVKVKNVTKDGRPAYQVQKKRRARILGIVPVDVNVETTVDANSGEKLGENKPWWNFLAF
ncbi:MAG: hypothetical protein GF416_04755 [Candidatus Altiarchaeales archaeon]|nr:hypothetical protein [Candidatus Altiarchaeales archaeon]MBD3416430.1 hypothetical protein [Candidatus Altiarchaeales archaeon]